MREDGGVRTTGKALFAGTLYGQVQDCTVWLAGQTYINSAVINGNGDFFFISAVFGRS